MLHFGLIIGDNRMIKHLHCIAVDNGYTDRGFNNTSNGLAPSNPSEAHLYPISQQFLYRRYLMLSFMECAIHVGFKQGKVSKKVLHLPLKRK